MTVTYQGSLTIGQCLPMALTASAHVSAATGTARDTLQAQLQGLITVSLQPPPSLAQLLAGAQQTVLALQAMIAAPLPDLSATTAAIAELQASLAGLAGALAFSASFADVLSTGGIRLYAYAGQAGQLGAELGGSLGGGLPGGNGPAESVAGFVLLANDAGAIAALRTVFGG